MRERGDGTDASELLRGANELKREPEDDRKPGGQPKPAEVESEAKEKSQSDVRELQRVKHDHAGDAATRADGWNVRARISEKMEQIPRRRPRPR